MITIDLQIIDKSVFVPSHEQFETWVRLAGQTQLTTDVDICLRIVTAEEITKLNQVYRHKVGSTNVLSFPYDINHDPDQHPLLGDLIFCRSVIEEEANSQGKLLLAHWAHVTIHGVLHLLGYDHLNDKQAAVMESLEISLLKQLNFPNPYE
jgi:probable rRNA maturation factor